MVVPNTTGLTSAEYKHELLRDLNHYIREFNEGGDWKPNYILNEWKEYIRSLYAEWLLIPSTEQYIQLEADDVVKGMMERLSEFESDDTTPAKWFQTREIPSGYETIERMFGTACETKGGYKLVRWLYDHEMGAIRQTHPMSPLRSQWFVFACSSGCEDTARWIHSLGGVDIHYDDDDAFRTASIRGYVGIVRWLHSLGGIHTHPEYHKDDLHYQKVFNDDSEMGSLLRSFCL